MPHPKDAFAQYCCELLHRVGHCQAKRMFGGWGISTEGITLAIVADLGAGETLYLKTNPSTQAQFEAAGCLRFVFQAKEKTMSMHYYSAPAEAMESPALMQPWAQLALEAALQARAAKAPKSRTPKPSRTQSPR